GTRYSAGRSVAVAAPPQIGRRHLQQVCYRDKQSRATSPGPPRYSGRAHYLQYPAQDITPQSPGPADISKPLAAVRAVPGPSNIPPLQNSGPLLVSHRSSACPPTPSQAPNNNSSRAALGVPLSRNSRVLQFEKH